MEHISDVLVIGSGLAGLSYALKVAEFARVNLITKNGLTETSTSKAQGGIAAVLGPDDRFEYHIQDTLTTGEGLSHPDIVELVVRQGPERIRELIDMGAHFDPGKDNGYDLGREGGHSHRRVIHAQDMTGAEVERILAEKVLAHPNIQVFENHMGVNLITLERVVRQGRVVTEAERTCLGAYVLNKDTGQVDIFHGPHHPAGHGRGRQGLPLHQQSRHRHRRRGGHGLPGRGLDRQHGIRPVPPHLPVSSRGQEFPHLRGPAGRRGHPHGPGRATLHGASTIP